MKCVCPGCGEACLCPTCGSEDGVLGTSYAYIICVNPDHGDHREQYWLPDGEHPSRQTPPLEWKDAVLGAPHGRCGSGAYYFEEATA